MTLDQLRALIAVHQEGSFRGAATALHKAQSAVSRSIADLEQVLQVKLFDRGQYRPRLTSAGETVLTQAKLIMADVDSLIVKSKILKSGTEPFLQIGVSALYPLEQLTPVLKQIGLQFPQTEVRLKIEVLAGDRLLREKQVDLVITDMIENSGNNENIYIQKVALASVAHRSHPLVKEKNRETLFVKYPQIVVSSSDLAQDRTAGVQDDQNRWSVTDFLAKKQLLMSGLGWGSMPLHLIQGELSRGTLVRIKKPDLEAKFYLCFRKNESLGPVAKFLVKSICS